MLFKQRLTKQQALPKIRQYCAYQERCHKEVREKLYSYGLFKNDVELALTELIEENYLDEERFAIQFAGGKFRIKQWGKTKISFALKERQVSAYCIKKALAQIEAEDYEKVINNLAAKKWASLKGEQYINREVKTRNYLLQKGYETAVITKALQLLRAK